MKRDPSCAKIRVELSARLDGEVDAPTSARLDEHLAGCSACRTHEADLRSARRSLRVTPAIEVPDLTGAIVARVAAVGPRLRRRDDIRSGIRIGAFTAAAAALLLIGSSLPFVSEQPQTAAASEIVAGVRAAAHDLEGYRASFAITERGWNDSVDVRHLTARVAYAAPENFRLKVRDLTTYPDRSWPRNDVDLVANARRWWIREPSTCPAEALPGCSIASGTEQRAVIHRQPFDGTTPLPTDILVPLETLASSPDFTVLGRTSIAGRAAFRVALPYREAVPLVNALQAGGLWRSFHPLDRVVIWIDAETWFPLRYEVMASGASERDLWARSQRYRDRAGERLLVVRATDFSEVAPTPADFGAPVRGTVRDGTFRSRSPGATRGWITPGYVAGLSPYRAGVVGRQRVLTFASGMTWLKVTSSSGVERPIYPATAEEVSTGAGYAYYRPANETLKRRMDVFGPGAIVHLESNLPRDVLIEVASSLDLRGRRMPSVIENDGARRVVRLQPGDVAERAPFALEPRYLPAGYKLGATLFSRSRPGGDTLTLYYHAGEADFAADGIRVAQSPSVRMLAPTGEEDVLGVHLRATTARWFPERGELEWIDDDGVYRSVTVDSFDLATAVRIARSLR